MEAREIVDECFSRGGVPAKDQDYWPAIERWITETVSGMYIKIPGLDPFGPSEQRDQLLADSLALAEEIFEEKRREREEQALTTATPYSASDPAAQIELIADAMPDLAWVGGGVGFVNAEEAEALRDGKPYPLANIDLLRLRDLRDGAAIDGSPDTDPFIIAMLARGYLQENPDYTRYAELSRQAKAQGKGFNVQWSDTMDVYIGFGGGNVFRRWIITEAGRSFAHRAFA